MSEKELVKAIEELVDKLELCRRTYVALWIPLIIGVLVILSKGAGFW